jgi:ribosomal protein S18 acetylase RimI-like enzyme
VGPGAEVAVRPARPGDVETMARIAQAAYELYLPRIGREPPPMRADFGALVARGDVWVAEQDALVVAYVVLLVAADHLVVENVAVLPSHQGSGIGSRLLQLAEDRARARGRPEVRLYTNEAMTENLGYYPRRGYRETHRVTEHGFRRVFFSKAVTDSNAVIDNSAVTD